MRQLDPSRESFVKSLSAMSDFILFLAGRTSTVLHLLYPVLFFMHVTRRLISHELYKFVSDGGTVQSLFDRLRRKRKRFIICLHDFAISIYFTPRDINSQAILPSFIILPRWTMSSSGARLVKSRNSFYFVVPSSGASSLFGAKFFIYYYLEKGMRAPVLRYLHSFLILYLPSKVPSWVTCVRPVKSPVGTQFVLLYRPDDRNPVMET